MTRRIAKLALLMVLNSMLCAIILCLPDNGLAESTSNTPSSVRLQVPLYGEEHNLSCEYASAHMITAYWGMPLDENRFIANIDPNDNPHIGFRGDINGVFGGLENYGIYAEPIAAYLNIKGFKTKLLAGGEAALRHELALGRPQLVWLTYALHNSYQQKVLIDDVPVTLVPWEHAVVVTGYDDGGVYVNGPADGSRAYLEWANFKRAWGYFDDMALSIWPAAQPALAEESLGVSPLFYRPYLNHGNLAIFGLPLSKETQENGLTVQYFERARFEYNPKSQEITFGLLGREVTAKRQQEAAFLPQPAPNVADSLYSNLTGHSLSPLFVQFWQDHEGLQVFGLPISSEIQENGLTVQYFERARLEYDAATQQVQVGDLGRERLDLPYDLGLDSALQILGSVLGSFDRK